VLPDTEDYLIFIRLDKTPERDGQTDGQTASGYYSSVKTVDI